MSRLLRSLLGKGYGLVEITRCKGFPSEQSVASSEVPLPRTECSLRTKTGTYDFSRDRGTDRVRELHAKIISRGRGRELHLIFSLNVPFVLLLLSNDDE